MSAEKFVACLADLHEAIRDEEQVRIQYQGNSWGYHGYRIMERRVKAGEALTEALNELIDARVKTYMEGA